MMRRQNNNNNIPNNFQPQSPMMQQDNLFSNNGNNFNNGMVTNGFISPMMPQWNVNNNQQNNLPQDDEGLSASIAQDIINVILGSSHNSCYDFQKALVTKEITDRLISDSSILEKYKKGLADVLQKLSSNGSSYKKMENGALRVLGGSDRVMDFMNDKIISYYAYGGREGDSMYAFFKGKKCYQDTSTKKDVYFDIIRCEYDLKKKTYKIIITPQGTEKKVIFKGDDVNNITGVFSGAHGFNVVVNGVYVSMSNDINIINQNFKDNNLKITADFIEPNKENTTYANNDIDSQDKPYDNFNYEKTNSGCSCFNWCSDCLKSCKEKCFRYEHEYV